MTRAPATRLLVPVALAVIVAIGDLVEAAIAWSAHHARQEPAVPGTSSWAAIYLFGIEAAAGALILLLAVAAAGRSPALAGAAAGLAWLRVVAVGVTALLMVFRVGFAGPFDGSDVLVVVLALIDGLAGAVICSVIAGRTRRGTPAVGGPSHPM